MALIGAIWFGTVLLFAAVAMQDITAPGVLLRDPQTTTRSPWYLGLVSNIGNVGWTVAATEFLGAAVVCRNLDPRRETPWFLVVPGVLCSVLLADDLILLHDDLLQRSVNLEPVIYGGYVIVVVGWLLVFRRQILAGPWPVGGLAAAALATSVLVDVAAADIDSDGRLLLEEGAKVAGIWTLAAYAGIIAVGSISRAAHSASPAPTDR